MTVAHTRVLALVALVALPFVDGCGDDDSPDTAPLARCGDGVVEGDEVCDDDNDDPRDGCTNECQLPACGDGVVHEGEQCDDGNAEDADGCTNACTPGPGAVVAVGTGEFHTCALSQSGVVRCWGAPAYGRLGQPGYGEHIGDDEPPVDWDPIDVADDVVDLVNGVNHACALRAGGQVRCWGNNDYGQLGYGHMMDIGDDETPAAAGDVPLPGPVIGLAAGSGHTCAVLQGGDVICWGGNGSGQLGTGTTDRLGDDESIDGALPIDLPGPAAEVAAGHGHSCARLQSGDVVCWGRQAEGQLGYGTPDAIGDDEPASAAGVVPLGGKAVDIDTFYNHTCAVLDDGGVRCWGSASSGQLGNGDQEKKNVGDRKTPDEDGVVMLDEPAVVVETGRNHTCALMASGDVRCWGSVGPSGVPDITGDQVLPLGPARVGAPVRRLSAGYGYNCAVLDTAAVRCWGSNDGARLGYPDVGPTTTVRDATTMGDVMVF